MKGFSLIETLVAMLLMMTVAGAVFALLKPVTTGFNTQLEVSDLQQRLRVGAASLQRELMMAGAGIPDMAAVMPYRAGTEAPDPPGTFLNDVVSVAFVRLAAPQTTVVRLRGESGDEKVLETRADCGGARQDPRCGFVAGMHVIVFEPRGTWDIATVLQVEDEALHLLHAGPLSSSYDRGDAVVSELSTHTYYLKPDPAGGQLMHYDGSQTDMPIVDNIVRLQFRYWGDPQPPRLLPGRPLSGPPPWTTYGPGPPEPGEPSGTSWPDGENCVFTIVDGSHVPRLPILNGGAFVPTELSAAMLTDGPWCPGDTSARRYDADLLRIRRIRVTIRVQAAVPWLRGPASTLFAHAGTAVASEAIPDRELAFDVSPRNMNLVR